MNAQTIAMTLSPVLQMSHRLLLALLLHCKALFPAVKLSKYIPPLSSTSSLPSTEEDIAAELAKQESYLTQIHMLMNAGFVTKTWEEQLWEVQRIITQLKRKYKTVQKSKGEVGKPENDSEEVKMEKNEVVEKIETNLEQQSPEKAEKKPIVIEAIEKDVVDFSSLSRVNSVSSPEEAPCSFVEKLRESLIYEELINMHAALKDQLFQERNEIEKLTVALSERVSEEQDSTRPLEEQDLEKTVELIRENRLLERKIATLIESVFEEKEACVELRVELELQQLMSSKNQGAALNSN